MKTTMLLTVALIAVAPLAGCATVINGTTCSVTITSQPEDADVTVVNSAGKTVFSGKSPAVVELRRGKGYFQGEDYTVKFVKSGYQPTELRIARRLDGWYFGNILLGGWIGMLIVDPLTGGMWTLDSDVCALLSPLASSFDSEATLSVVCLNDVPENLRKHLREIR